MKFLKNIHQLKDLTFTHKLVLAAWVLIAVLPSCKKTEYLDTDNANDWWEKLKDKVEVVYPIEDFEYNMREFAIRDCNGYMIQFGQEIG